MPAEIEGDSHGNEPQYSLAPFVATCHLTVILSDLLPLSNHETPASPAHKTATLRRASEALTNMDTTRIPARTCTLFEIAVPTVRQELHILIVTCRFLPSKPSHGRNLHLPTRLGHARRTYNHAARKSGGQRPFGSRGGSGDTRISRTARLFVFLASVFVLSPMP